MGDRTVGDNVQVVVAVMKVVDEDRREVQGQWEHHAAAAAKQEAKQVQAEKAEHVQEGAEGDVQGQATAMVVLGENENEQSNDEVSECSREISPTYEARI